jgi:hypothetical protein
LPPRVKPGDHWSDRVFAQRMTALAEEKAPVVEMEELIHEEPCPRCGRPMQCYGNLENKIIPMNPPQEDATWACHSCRLKRKIRREVTFEHDPSRIKFYELSA